MAPPARHVPRFDAPYNSLQIGVVVSFGVSYFLATATLLLRYFQAMKLVRKLEVDLIIVTISYAISLIYFVTMVNLMNYGWGKHLWDVSLAQLMEFNKGLLINTMTYLMTPSITKMAMLAVLFRINPSKTYRMITVVLAVVIFAYTLTLLIITGGPCNPLKRGTSLCLQNVALSQAILNIASDLAVVAVPLPTIYALHLPLKQKFSIGGLVACRGIWSIVEVNLGIICACAMRLKPLIVIYFLGLSLFPTNKSSTNNQVID
ncbi:hypothetical protein P280DRAFT_506681 [Massarina eburnea CBS 473.64]|uniref:Rhodopsin domain-containing protein n=1 Tax=Massarina eburnea CBS 473.64 TaxID=1395130 RepID=A0A6A6S4C9_9PLEO|nr:hypothetical protein P280DRAFT_506681 [Massarina eburnea CBS 473.64]